MLFQVFYKFKSDVDIPALTIVVVDNSQAANWWLAISDRYESIRGIKAGALVEGSIKYLKRNALQKKKNLRTTLHATFILVLRLVRVLRCCSVLR